MAFNKLLPIEYRRSIVAVHEDVNSSRTTETRLIVTVTPELTWKIHHVHGTTNKLEKFSLEDAPTTIV